MHKDIALDSFLHILISRVVSFEFFKKFKIVFISIIVHIYSVRLEWVPQHVWGQRYGVGVSFHCNVDSRDSSSLFRLTQ